MLSMRFRRPFGRAAVILFALAVTACASVDRTKVVDPPVEGTEVSPSLLDNTQHVLKRRVAIARFTNETLYGKSVLLLREANFVAGQASDILATRLAESGKFTMYEYGDSLRLLESLDEHTVGDLGIPADYVIIGSLSEFGRETTGETGVFSRTKIQKAYARVNVRLVDVHTSEIIYAEEGSGTAEVETGTTFGVGTKAGYDSTLNDKAISAAVSRVVGNIVEKLLEQPWRSYVLTIESGTVIIAGGESQGVRQGDEFKVMRRGRMVDNPQTGFPMELPRTEVARIRVESVFGNTPQNEGSRCAVISGSVPGDDLTQFIVEEVRR